MRRRAGHARAPRPSPWDSKIAARVGRSVSVGPMVRGFVHFLYVYHLDKLRPRTPEPPSLSRSKFVTQRARPPAVHPPPSTSPNSAHLFIKIIKTRNRSLNGSTPPSPDRYTTPSDPDPIFHAPYGTATGEIQRQGTRESAELPCRGYCRIFRNIL